MGEQEALSAIFLGQAGGTTLRNYAAIGTVVAVRRAHITLDHRLHHQEITISTVAAVRAAGDFVVDEPVSWT